MKTSQLIKALIEAEAESQRIEFYSLGSGGHYSSKQKSYATEKAQGIGVRATGKAPKGTQEDHTEVAKGKGYNS